MVCVLTNFFDFEGHKTIINVDVASGLNNLGDVFVIKPQYFLITVLHELVVKCELDGFTLLQLNLSGATLESTRSILLLNILLFVVSAVL